MNKKIILGASALVLCFSITACSNSKKKNIETEASLTQEQADSAALSFIEAGGISQAALMQQLTNEGYSEEEVTKAIEKTGADFSQEAIEYMNAYLVSAPYSRSAMEKILQEGRFTDIQINFAFENNPVDWSLQASKALDVYINEGDYTEAELKDKLKADGFTDEEISTLTFSTETPAKESEIPAPKPVSRTEQNIVDESETE